MAENQIVTRAEFVRVVDENGDPVPGFPAPVPASWVGSSLLPEGTKRAPKREDAPAGGGSQSAGVFPEGAPSTGWKAEELRAYAKAHGIDLPAAANRKDEMVAVIEAAAQE